MKRATIGLCILALAATTFAQDANAPHLRFLKPPKGVTLTPEQKRILDDANKSIIEAYQQAGDQYEPGKAADALRKAVAASAIIGAAKSLHTQHMVGIAPGDMAGEQADKLDSEGGLESMTEIAMEYGIRPSDEIDNGLHKRKIVKAAKDEANGLKLSQQNLSKILQEMQQAGGGGEQDKKQDQKENKNQQNKPKPGGGQQQQNDKGQKNDPNRQNPQNQPNQGGGGQEQPGQTNTAAQAGQQQPNPQGNPNQRQQGGGHAQPGQTNNSNQAQTGQQQQAGGGQQQLPGQTNGTNQAQQGGEGQPQDRNQLVNKQDNISRTLAGQASQLLAQGGDADPTQKAADAFRRAAEQAAKTSDLIKEGNLSGAADASRETERKIDEAMRATGQAGADALSDTLRALENQVGALQSKQQELIKQTGELDKKGGSGGQQNQPSDKAAAQKTQGIAAEQIRQKAQIDDLQTNIKELAQTGGTGTEGQSDSSRTPENTARQELGKTAQSAEKNKVSQAAVNAAVRAGQGDTDAALKEMTEVQKGLAAIREGVAAADRAANAGADTAKLERDLHDLKQFTGELNRLKSTARAAAHRPNDGQNPHPDPSSDSKTDSASEQVSPGVGNLLNDSFKQARNQISALAGELQGNLPKATADILEATKADVAFDKDLTASLAKIDKLLGVMRNVEKQLAEKVGDEKEKNALRSYRKDGIPGSYRDQVKSYYDSLAAGVESK